MSKNILQIIADTCRYSQKLSLLFTLLFACLFLSAQNDVIVEGDLSVIGDGSQTNFKVAGPAGEIRFNPYFSGTATTLLGYFDGKDLSPQVRFDHDASSFIDVGMDTTGAFVVEQKDSQVFRIDTSGNTAIGVIWFFIRLLSNSNDIYATWDQ